MESDLDQWIDEAFELAVSGSGDYDLPEDTTIQMEEDEWRISDLGECYPSSFNLAQAIKSGYLVRVFPSPWPFMMYIDLVVATERCREAYATDELLQAVSFYAGHKPTMTDFFGVYQPEDGRPIHIHLSRRVMYLYFNGEY